LNNSVWIFLDFDGVIANSYKVMFNTYMEFLKKFGLKGNETEFRKLDGPNLYEIIDYLKSNYNLKKTKNELVEEYYKKIQDEFNKKAEPSQGITILLDFLKKNNYKLGLVTSSLEKIVNPFLRKYNLFSYFDLYVFGDEIEKSKPDPQIYQLGIKKAKVDKNKIIVLEDSEHGITSATKAGLFSINVKEKKPQEIISLIKG